MANGSRLTIYCDETDTRDGKPTFELIVKRAEQLKCRHVVVSSGILGSHRGRTEGYLADQLPVVVEIIAEEVRMKTLLPFVTQLIQNGTATLESVEIL
jgi:PII-like signaling protein